MNDYFFPALFIVPEFEAANIQRGPFRLSKRLWETSTFDLATLATRHALHLPYQIMDVFLGKCNVEICIEQQESLESAVAHLRSLKLALYGTAVSPFVTPFVTSHSINNYSGMNSRDSDSLRPKLPAGMQEGITSESATVEAWPLDLTFQCVVLPDSLRVTDEIFTAACDKASVWSSMIASHDTLRGFSDAALSTSMMGSLSQSILHMWCAIESLFPSVGAELSFRVSLYLSELITQGASRRGYFDKVKKGYNTRSRIAHGAKHEASIDEWKATWEIVTDAFNAIVRRGVLSSEEALLADLLS